MAHPTVEVRSGLEVIKLEYSLRLKIMRNGWLLVDTCSQVAIIALYFESENELKFYNLELKFYNLEPCGCFT